VAAFNWILEWPKSENKLEPLLQDPQMAGRAAAALAKEANEEKGH
jgi:hypothetical protein